MKKFNNPIKDFAYFLYRWINPVFDPVKLALFIPKYAVFFASWMRYSLMSGSEKSGLIDSFPSLYDNLKKTPFDSHYFYQDIWAFKKVKISGAPAHVDVGSRIDYVGFLTAICNVTFIDIRPLLADLDNYKSIAGSILKMPYEDNSVSSISCLHVAEHIGLGRYGDPLDPFGTKKACAELKRVLAVGGSIYFSLPVGRPRLCFNSHRIHSPGRILEYFEGLELVELSGINDDGRFITDIKYDVLENSDYACGLFHFKKPVK